MRKLAAAVIGISIFVFAYLPASGQLPKKEAPRTSSLHSETKTLSFLNHLSLSASADALLPHATAPTTSVPTTAPPPPTTTTTTTAPIPPPTTTTTAPPPPPASSVTPLEYAEWTKVAICEEGGWIGYAGYNYPDSLGINRTNWYAYGGGSDLSPDAQILVAERIQFNFNPPDQNGCAAW